MEKIAEFNDLINTFVWTKVGVWLLIATGMLLTVLTKFFQVTHIGHWMKKTVGSMFDKKVIGHTDDKASISQFQALCTALAATVGVGNIAGVSAAIITGGPGAVFWMWLAAFFGMMTNYSENILGIYYRRKNYLGEWSGGAMYYLQDGLGGKNDIKGIKAVKCFVGMVLTVLLVIGILCVGPIIIYSSNLSSAIIVSSFWTILYYIVLAIVLITIVALTITKKWDSLIPISEKVLGAWGKLLAVVFAICAVLASFGIGNMGQVNKIVKNLTSAFDIKALSSHVLYSSDGTDVTLYMLIVGLIIMALVGFVVIGGLQRIAIVAEKIIPFMVVMYILGSLVIIVANAGQIGTAFGHIFGMAFTKNAAWGGATGVAFKTIITQGCKRGVFSNEAGLGSSVMVHSNSNVREPVKQGLWGIFEVFADTIIVCTMTAMTILTSGVIDLETGIPVTGDDATLVAEAFNTIFKAGSFEFGRGFIAIAILLFAFTTVLGWSHYGTKAVEYLAGKNAAKATRVYKIIFVVMIISGALLTSSLAWDISDTFNGMMMIPNLIGVLSLTPLVMKLTKNYVRRRIRGEDIEPMLSFDPEIQKENAKVIKETGEE